MKPSYLLILIASALLLSGLTESVITPSSQPSQSTVSQSNVDKTQSTHATPDQGAERSGAIASLGDQGHSMPAANQTTSYTYNYYCQSQQTDGLPLWFQITATVLALVFTVGLLCTSLWQYQATQAALHINRPFLIVKQPRMKGEREAGGGSTYWVPKCVQIDVENFGTGPADVIDVSCSTYPYNPPPPDPRVEYRIEDRLAPYIPVIAAGASPELIRYYFDLGPLVQAVVEEKKRLGVYGEIRYRGGAPDEITQRASFGGISLALRQTKPSRAP